MQANSPDATWAADLRSRLRVYTISDQDDTGPWIRASFPDVLYVASVTAWNAYRIATWTGMFDDLAGSNTTTVSDGWLATHIQRGPLGSHYPTPELAVEGDSPSLLYLVQNGLGHAEFPDWGSWGGRYGYVCPGSRHYHDVGDQVVVGAADGQQQGTGSSSTVGYFSNQATIWRWRDHFQTDFAARMQWTLTRDFANASHPPVPVVNGTQGPQFLNLTTQPGGSLVLDAGQSYDPDHPDALDSRSLSFQWYQYLEPTEYVPTLSIIPTVTLEALSPPAGTNGTLAYNDAGFVNVVLGQTVRVIVPTDETGLAYHIVLQVSNEASLRRYLRVVINV